MTNKESESGEFETLMAYTKKMHIRLFNALSAFYAYESLRELTAPNIAGQSESKKNVKIMSKFKDFFTPTQEALRIHFSLELAKLFDISNQSLHINKIVNFTESSLKHLKVNDFKDYNEKQGRKFIEDMVSEYREINYEDLMKIKDMLKKHEVTINKLKTYRDKWLAHDDINKPTIPGITVIEIKNLFNLLIKILNSISGRLNKEMWRYDHIENDVKAATKLLVEHLRRFEPYLLKEIREKYE